MVESHFGTMHWPTHAYNNWQIWRDYSPDEIATDLDRAASLNVTSLRVILSYEFWAEEAIAFRDTGTGGNAAIDRLVDYMDKADDRGMNVMPVLFEPIGAEPMNGPPHFGEGGEVDVAPVLRRNVLNDKNIETSFAVHSPSQNHIIQPSSWGMEDQSPVLPNAPDGRWFASPLHFTRRVTNAVGDHPALLAIEVMNEPGVGIKREEFVIDMGNAIRDEDSSVPVTVGAKDFGFQDFVGNINYNAPYEDGISGGLDYHQFHMNLPALRSVAEDYLSAAGDYRQQTGKPLLCTEWQRLQTEPPSRFLPNYEQLGGLVNDAIGSEIDGAHFWGLNLKPAYIEKPRRDGRINGVFRPDGTVFDKGDADSIAGESTNLLEDHSYPGWIQSGADTFPFPELGGDPEPPDEGGVPNWAIAAGVGAGAAALYFGMGGNDDGQ